MTLSREETIQLLKIEAELERRSRQRKLYGYFPDEGPYRRDLYQKHLEFFRHGKTAGERIFLAANRVGKALKHGTKVATPAGWTVIEDLRIGDVVIAGDGSPTKVVGVYPQGEVELFDISFDGVHAISSCAEHRWLFQHPRARYPYRQSHGKREPNPFYREWMIGDTKALAAFGAIPRTRAVIPITKPFLIGDSAPLPLDPYVLGVMLGDGGLTGKSMKLSSADEEILAAVRAHFNVVHYDAFDYGVNKSVAVFRELGLQGCDSSAKFIPKQYLYADEVTRLAVLQGLMDTDGSISMPNRCMEYSTCSDALADGFEWLAASLGMKTVRNRRHTKAQNGNGKPSWRIALRANRLCPFRLARKATRWRPAKETDNYIVHSVKPSGRGLATCIEVDHASHTYVIEHGIVTHNTESGGGYELACHLTGEYPHWWEGRRFDRPIKAWAAGDTSKTVKEILQNKLLGDIADRGTGVIPGALLGKLSPWVGVPDGVGEAWVKHVPTGRWSRLEFKSYDQGRISFQGTEIDAILLDEESPLDIVDECRLRTTATGNFKGGILMSTFTPLNGVTEYVAQALEKFEEGSEHIKVVTAGWDDVPHLEAAEKARLISTMSKHQLKVRTTGVPDLGDGMVFPIEDEMIKVDPFPIPDHWPRVAAIDFGWDHPTAVIWMALDRDEGVAYIYGEYAQSQTVPAVHAEVIKARGVWIPMAWPHDGLNDVAAGPNLASQYLSKGVNMLPEHAQFSPDGISADTKAVRSSVEAGLQAMLNDFTTGKLKVFSSCTGWFGEKRWYRREKGKLIKKNDDRISASRYAYMSLDYAITKPKPRARTERLSWKVA